MALQLDPHRRCILVVAPNASVSASPLHLRHASRARQTTSTSSLRLSARQAVLAPVPSSQEQPEQPLRPLPRLVEGVADDASLNNPLERWKRLSTAWFGVIMEYEGVLVESTEEAHIQAWLAVAQEMDYPRPLGQLFRRIKGLRDEVVVSRVFSWTHNPKLARSIAARKAVLYEQLLASSRQPAAMLEARPFLDLVKRNSIPLALACALPEAKVKDGLARHGLSQYFDSVVTAEDSGAPEVEFTLAYAAQQIQRPPARCVVVGESNTSVEAAHELGMKCVVVAGNAPVYNYGAADLVVKDLSDLRFINLKRLFANEELVSSAGNEPVPQMELDPEAQADFDLFN